MQGEAIESEGRRVRKGSEGWEGEEGRVRVGRVRERVLGIPLENSLRGY